MNGERERESEKNHTNKTNEQNPLEEKTEEGISTKKSDKKRMEQNTDKCVAS